MQIAMNTVVTMTYELKNSDGEVLEASTEEVGHQHVHGAGGHHH